MISSKHLLKDNWHAGLCCQVQDTRFSSGLSQVGLLLVFLDFHIANYCSGWTGKERAVPRNQIYGFPRHSHGSNLMSHYDVSPTCDRLFQASCQFPLKPWHSPKNFWMSKSHWNLFFKIWYFPVHIALSSYCALTHAKLQSLTNSISLKWKLLPGRLREGADIQEVLQQTPGYANYFFR